MSISLEEECRHKCGIVGNYLFNEKDFSSFDIAYEMLRQLQHRGDLSAGFASFSKHYPEGYIRCGVKAGRVIHGFGNLIESKDKYMENKEYFGGKFTIGQVRYATSGTNNLTMDKRTIESSGQPRHRHHIRCFKEHAFCWNGNIPNLDTLEKQIAGEWENYNKKSFNDTVLFDIVFSKFVAERVKHPLETNDFRDMFKHVVQEQGFQGSFSMLYMDANGNLVAARDPHGFKPFVYKIIEDFGVLFASETNSIDKVVDLYNRKSGKPLVEPETFDNLQPGHIIHISNDKVYGPLPFVEKLPKPSRCIFEYIYFAKAESFLDKRSVYDARYELGRELAKTEAETNIILDDVRLNSDDYIITCIPKTPLPIVKGYCEELSGMTGKYFAPIDVLLLDTDAEYGLIDRTFTDDIAENRPLKNKRKFTLLKHKIRGKKLIVIDDSIVRGNVSREIVGSLREVGAKEVHMRSAAAQIPYGCYDGAIDMPHLNNQISYKRTPAQVNDIIGATTTLFNPGDYMIKAVAGDVLPRNEFCTACFDSNYVTDAAKQRFEEEVIKYNSINGVK